jgi:hypothetical protein
MCRVTYYDLSALGKVGPHKAEAPRTVELDILGDPRFGRYRLPIFSVQAECGKPLCEQSWNG